MAIIPRRNSEMSSIIRSIIYDISAPAQRPIPRLTSAAAGLLAERAAEIAERIEGAPGGIGIEVMRGNFLDRDLATTRRPSQRTWRLRRDADALLVDVAGAKVRLEDLTFLIARPIVRTIFWRSMW